MTWQEKNSVLKLLREGVLVRDIASKLEISQNTVKSFCRRNSAMTEGTDLFCQNCGVVIPQMLHRKEKKFCSSRCREKWWNSHLNLVNRKAFYHLTCKYCGKEYDSYGNCHRSFCSWECYIAARREESS